MLLRKFLFLGLLMLLFACKSGQINRKVSKKLDTHFYENQFTGLLVYNPKTEDTVINYNANKYFTPASNTKIITLYTALQFLPDSIPAFKYYVEADTLNIIGTGDPTFLHTYFKDSTALKMANKYKKVNLIIDNFPEDKFGYGWAWEDYDQYFSPERSSFPMYGNVITVCNNKSLQSIPKALINKVQLSSVKFRRHYNKNEFYYSQDETDTLEIPMVIDTLLIKELWNDIAPNKVSIASYSPNEMKIAYSIETDSVVKRMMHKSDNFLAEQLLILSSSTLSDTLNSKKTRQRILKNQLNDLKQKPRWVDGSGLSRYNLFTPSTFVYVLNKLYNEVPRERLFNFFPVGGKLGTLKSWYAGNPEPYIYAKSGTLSNNYSLSGYLITKKGETLIFSFMNNHYRESTSEIKKQMQLVFEYLRDNY